ncbi:MULTISPECIES: chitin binding peritrophin-A domain-containing protein [unclassified Streptomyces]|uniref:chitin binding peritrophin-A domain-containing protein n=1 Tax=unclassified Streptomyces TaxID=2593676 RepID=UPI003B632144
MKRFALATAALVAVGGFAFPAPAQAGTADGGVVGCHGHQYGDLYADPNDPHWFYHCAHGAGGTVEAHRKECPSVLVFNPEFLVCDWPQGLGTRE